MQTQGDLLVLRATVSDARFGELDNAKFTRNPLTFSRSIIAKVQIQPTNMMDNSNETGKNRSGSCVFISYARKDGADCASSLHEKLQQVQPPIGLWQDRIDMQSGRWWDQLQDAIKQCDTMIIVLTPCALASHVCRQEWQCARQNGVKVVPVLCPEYPVNPSDKSVPQWMRAEHWFNPMTQWDNLISDLGSPARRDRVPFMAADLPDNFVERPELFQELRDQILQDNVQPVVITTSLQGAGGFGKTTLARALCHDGDVISHFYHGKREKIPDGLRRSASYDGKVSITGKTPVVCLSRPPENDNLTLVCHSRPS